MKYKNADNVNSTVYWRFNGSSEENFAGSHEYTIPGPVSTANDGVYEAFYGPNGDSRRHGIVRLIVRGTYISSKKYALLYA